MPQDDVRVRGESFNLGDSGKYTRLGWISICFIVYFNVCGGPWGSEEIISSAGPLAGLVGCVVFSLLWAVPLSMITAELSSVYADDGGYAIWVAEGLGPFWGFQEAYWSWVSGVIDTAIYPVLAYDTAMQVMRGSWDAPLVGDKMVCYANGTDSSGGDSDDEDVFNSKGYMIKMLLAVVFTVPNMFSPHSFGKLMRFLGVIVMLPFVVQCVFLLYHYEDLNSPRILLEVSSNPDWFELLMVLYWNFSGFDAISTCAGEVDDPGRNFPRGLFSAILLVFLSYVVPLSIFTLANKPFWQCWDEGWFSVIAEESVGQWMAIWIVVTSFVGNAGMYTAEVFEDSWQLCGMARQGLMPSIFARKHGDTPTVAILFSLLIIATLLALGFNEIVCITNLFSCLSSLLEFVAFVKLRVSKPDMVRPYKLPIDNIVWLLVFFLFPCGLGVFVCIGSLASSTISVVLNGVALVGGIGLYHYMHYNGNIQYQYQNERTPLL